jgi:hypothetical protein
MLYKSKLKGSFGRYYPISLVIIYILCLVEVMIRTGFKKNGMEIQQVPMFSFSLMGFFFIAMGFWQLKRIQLWIYPVLGLLAGVGCFLAIYLFPSPSAYLITFYVINLLVIIFLIILFWPVLSAQERFEANARRIFSLSVEMIEDKAGGFTDRPYAAGKIAINPDDELEGFIRFLDGRFIARSLKIKDARYLLISMNKSVLATREPDEVSHLQVTREGSLIVRICQPDYRQYRARYNFDQLCASLAGVFFRFYEYYRDGKEDRIVRELKTAK